MVCSMSMGFKEDPKTFLNKAMVQLAKVESLKIHYKNIQAWDTRRDLMMLYCPAQPSTDVIIDEVRQMLDECDREFKVANPHL